MAGRSAVPLDHPNYIFGFGRGGDVVKQEADVILVAGSRLGNLDLPYDKYWGDPARQQLIQIDVDPRNMGVTRPLALGIVADVQATRSKASCRRCARRKARPRDGTDLARYRQAAQAWWDEQLAPGRRLDRARASIRRTRCRRSARSSAATRSTSPTAATRRCGRTRACRRRGRARTTASSSSACSAPAFRRPSAPSSARRSARSCASPATAPPASTSWRCSRRRATA